MKRRGASHRSALAILWGSITRSCAARIFDCMADLCLRQRPGRGDGWLAGVRLKIVYLLVRRESVPGGSLCDRWLA